MKMFSNFYIIGNMENVKSLFVKYSKYKLNDIIKIELIHDGFSNINYLIELKNKEKFQFKISKGINVKYDNELKALKLYNDKNYIYFNNQGYRIKKWIEGSVIKFFNDDLIIDIAKKLKHLHSIKPIDLIKHNYRESLFVDLDIKYLNNYLLLINKYKDDKLVFSHNDLNANNIIRKHDKAYFIDFEYSRANSLYWDIANLINESNFNSWQRKVLVITYDDLNNSKLNDYIYINIFYSYAWAINHPDQKIMNTYRLKLKNKLLNFNLNTLSSS